jgi:uncharacterized membrane protein YqgA involved in biofilm formation
LTGTLLNIGTIIAGSLMGLLFGARLPERVRESVLSVLGVFTLAIGIDLFLRGMGSAGENPLVPLVSLLLGVLIGEWARLETRLQNLGTWLQSRFAAGQDVQGNPGRFVRGFVSASLLFCIGPMTILGAIQDGLTGDYQLLAIKAVLDGFASLALASNFGIGVLFSILVVLVYQGGISLAAAQLQAVLTGPMLAELSVVGGVLLLSLALSTLLKIKDIRTANLLPALLVAPLLVLILRWFGL